MNILICDDDKLYVDMIRKYVDEFFADHKITDYKVYEYNSGDEVAKNNEKIDIAFLDVEMDGINGIEAGKCLRNNNKNIVLFIITSYMGYLDDAMDEGVFRYINKLLERPVIMRGLHKALLLCSKSQSKKINIEYKGDNVIIEQDSIICIESLVRKRYIKTDTQSYISLKSLSYWQSVLDEDKFFLVNKSFIVNIDRVERFTDKYIELMIGQSSTEAERKRAARLANKALPPPRTNGGHLSDIRPPEIEIKKEIDIEIEKERELETGQAPARSYGRYNNVFLSDTELDELKAELPDKWEYYIDRLSTHIASKGTKYRSHAATIYKWAQEDEAKKPPKKGIPDYTFKEGESL